MKNSTLLVGVVLALIVIVLGSGKVHADTGMTTSDGKSVVVMLDGVINMASTVPIIRTLNKAQPGTTITLLINSPGGAVFPALSLVDAMIATKAKVICHITKMAYSAAAVIAFSCPNLTANKLAFVGIHKAAISGIFGGNRLTSNELIRIAQDLDAVDKLLYYGYLEGSLNEAEQKVFWDGKDVVMPARVFVERHNKLKRSANAKL